MDAYIDKVLLSRLFFTPLIVILASFYLFPFEFSFAIGYNTKMLMAGFGLIVFLVRMVLNRKNNFNKQFLHVLLWGGLVSICGLLSVLYNGTNDFAYTTYAISMLVWISAANVVVSVIQGVHGYISVELLCKYLIAVCVFQCISALLIDNFTWIKTFINTYIATIASTVSSGDSLTDAGRLYGIGAALDVAGSRFSAVLIMVAACTINKNMTWQELTSFLVCFVFILVIGSAISRTTSIGVIIAIAFWIYSFIKGNVRVSKKIFWNCISSIILLSTLVIIYLYFNNANFYNNFRFAFEGFFNWAETGNFRTNSTDVLSDMYRFPESMKTWIIGDGYFADPRLTDPYYTGISYSAFYMGTDVGYLRFIYYFGLVGLVTFMIYFLKVTKKCMDCLPDYKMMFIFILLVNFAVWFKVSTDIFVVLAPFLCINKEDNDAYMEHIALQS